MPAARRSPRRKSCSPPVSATPRWRRCSGSARRCGRSAARSSSPSAPAAPGRCRSAASGRPRKARSCSAAARRRSASTPAQNPAVMRKIADRAVLYLPVARRIADRARLGGAARHAARRAADLRRVRALPRRLYRQLPQRRHAGRGARRTVRADGGIRRARPDDGAVLGEALRCSGCGLTRRRASGSVAVEVEGRAVRVPQGASAAAAVLLAGLSSIRDTPVAGAERAPYCMMGVCFDCLAEIDGVPNRQSCMVDGPTRHAHPPPARRDARRPRRRHAQPIRCSRADLTRDRRRRAGRHGGCGAGQRTRPRHRTARRAGQPRRPDLPRDRARRRGRPRNSPLGADYLAGPPARRGAARQPRPLPAGDDGLAHRSGRGRRGGVTVSVAGDGRQRDDRGAPHPAGDRGDRAAGADPGLDPARA